MKPYPALLSLGVAFAVLCAHANASSGPSNSASTKKMPDASSEINASTPHALSNVGSPAARHVFPVLDEKGLLLTCVAPELDTNRDTDDFKNCALAPGRTLDDVMHSFIRAAHQQQRELEAEQGAARKHADDTAETKSASK